jgi:Mrp family chromosome partitioning ATPase
VDQSLAEGDHARTLTVLPSGMRPENSSELLESVRMRDVIEELEARFDLVIIDTPPITVLSDALTLVGQVSGVVAVSAAGKTTGDAVRDFLRQIELLRGHLLGVVVNFATSNEKAAGSYYAQR